MTMRRAAVSMVLAGALATVTGFSGCGSPTYTFRSQAAIAPPEAPDLGAREARVLHFGDFGDDTGQQAAVARGIAAAHRRDGFDFALHAGDNLYDCGPDPTLPGAEACRFDASDNEVEAGAAPPEDPRFAALFEGALGPLAEPPALPIYLALGNHDVAAGGGCAAEGLDPATTGRRKACLEVAHASPLWRMPARHYVVDHGRARFIVVDTNLARGSYGGFSFEDEVRFVEEAAAGCGDRVCFVLAHHPLVTAGNHARRAPDDYLDRMERLRAAGGGRIRAWLAGDDHDLQHLRTPDGLDVFVSGNGARGRSYERFTRLSVEDGRLVFASVRWGVGSLEVHERGWTYRFEDANGAALYCCAASGDGPCEPVRCRG
jgi:tartrate-resistant acid phosphatase type 5